MCVFSTDSITGSISSGGRRPPRPPQLLFSQHMSSLTDCLPCGEGIKPVCFLLPSSLTGSVSSALFQLIKTHNLLPNRNYIFGYHPHGIFCFGAFCNFGTEATGFSKKFPGIRPSLATLAGNFRLPVLRDYLMSGGEVPRQAAESWPYLIKPIALSVSKVDFSRPVQLKQLLFTWSC